MQQRCCRLRPEAFSSGLKYIPVSRFWPLYAFNLQEDCHEAASDSLEHSWPLPQPPLSHSSLILCLLTILPIYFLEDGWHFRKPHSAPKPSFFLHGTSRDLLIPRGQLTPVIGSEGCVPMQIIAQRGILIFRWTDEENRPSTIILASVMEQLIFIMQSH